MWILTRQSISFTLAPGISKGIYDSAKIYFQKAADLDGLRFRAPSAINAAIRELASKYENVHLVDTRAVFETHSLHGIIGNELMLEHVHPNLDGYALMSDAFYQSIKNNNLIRVDSIQEMSFDIMKKQMPTLLWIHWLHYTE